MVWRRRFVMVTQFKGSQYAELRGSQKDDAIYMWIDVH